MLKHQNYRRAIEENLLIVDKDKNEVPFILNKAQVDFLERSTERNVILKARKMGFSSLVLAVGLMKFLHGENERVVSMSFDKDAASKQLDRVKRFLQSYEQINKTKIKLNYNTKYEMAFTVTRPDGSSYTNSLRVGTANSRGFGRGDDITFLHLTEVSLADNIDELLASVGEAVVNEAMITLETTANGYNAFKTFWDEAVANQRGYKAFFYDPSWEYSTEYLAQKKAELGKLYDQEYPATAEIAFLTSGDTYFDLESLRELRGICQEPINDNKYMLEFRKLKPGEFVLIFADTAWGGGDFCAAQFLSKTHIDVPRVFHKKCLASEMTPIIHQQAEEIFDITGVPPVVCYERQNGGIAEIQRIATLNRLGKYSVYRQPSPPGMAKASWTNKLGWDTSSLTRPVMLSMLKECLDNKLLRVYHAPTITEAYSFVEKQTPNGWKPQAESGAHDDLIMSLAGAWQLYQTQQPPEVEEDEIPTSGNLSKLYLR